VSWGYGGLHYDLQLQLPWYLEQEDKAEMELDHHSIRFGRRTFFFDPGRQARGMFVRLTEVST
jgi:hypothetical protein